MPDEGPSQQTEQSKPFSILSKWKEATFLLGATGMSVLFGFARTVASVGKNEPKVQDNVRPNLHFEGNRLAMRALGWGTFYAVTGTGLFCFGIWKLSGAKSFEEFRIKAGNVLPRIPRREPTSEARTKFANLTDLIQHIIDEDETNKNKIPAKSNPVDK